MSSVTYAKAGEKVDFTIFDHKVETKLLTCEVIAYCTTHKKLLGSGLQTRQHIAEKGKHVLAAYCFTHMRPEELE